MPVRTFGGQTAENMPAASRLLQQGDDVLESGDSAAAIDCYIRAADLIPSIPPEYAVKAVRLITADTSFRPRFEAARICGCLLESAYNAEDSEQLLEMAFKAFERVLRIWRTVNMAPLQHLVMLGEGGMVSLVQPVWNTEGRIDEEWRLRSDDPEGLETTVRGFAAQGFIYAVSLDTLYGWRPFMISPPIKDDADLRDWMRYNRLFGVQYISQSFLQRLNRVRESNGRSVIRAIEKLELPASMRWYKNFGYDFKNRCLEGMPMPAGDAAGAGSTP